MEERAGHSRSKFKQKKTENTVSVSDTNSVSEASENNEEYAKMNSLSITNWFATFLIQDIPIIGGICLIVWALSDKYSEGKRQYAIARLIYKLIWDLVALATLYVAYIIGSGLLEKLIEYMDKL